MEQHICYEEIGWRSIFYRHDCKVLMMKLFFMEQKIVGSYHEITDHMLFSSFENQISPIVSKNIRFFSRGGPMGHLRNFLKKSVNWKARQKSISSTDFSFNKQLNKIVTKTTSMCVMKTLLVICKKSFSLFNSLVNQSSKNLDFLKYDQWW